MSSYPEIQSRIFQAFGQSQFAEALELVTSALPQFPEHAKDLYYWRACLHGLLGQAEGTLQTLQEAVAVGLWFPPDMLRWDPDLKLLAGHPALDGLMATCAQRRDTARAATVPTRITLEPSAATAGPAPLLIATHGNGGNAETEAPQWQPLANKGWRVALPNSTQAGRAPGQFVWDDQTWGFQDVAHHWQQLQAAHATDRDRILTGGFSMGGGLAMRLALTGAVPARGFIAVAPWLPSIDQLRADLEASRVQGVRGYLVLGEQDTHAVQLGQQVIDLMAEFGLECRQEIHPGLGHVYPPTFGATLQQALAFLLA